MQTYSFLRELADSWALLLMFGFFAAIVIWAFRPGSKATHSDTANLIFRNEDTPIAPSLGDPANKEAGQ